MGTSEVGAVDVGLDLAQRDGGGGDAAVAIPDAITGILPPLVGQSPVGHALVLDVSIAVEVPVVLDPLEGPFRVGQELVHDLAGQPPAPQLSEQHDEERGGVGGAVVNAAAAERQRRRVTETHLVQDAAGLLLTSGVDVLPLEPGQCLQDPEGQVGIDEQGHPRRDERVAAEDGHEPWRPGRHHHALGKIRVEDAEGPEILGTRRDDRPQPVVVGLDLRHLAAPTGQALRRGGALDGLAAQIARVDRLAFDHRVELEAPGPLPVGGADGLEAGEIVRDQGRRREEVDDQTAADGAAPVRELELCLAVLAGDLSVGIAEPTLFDGEEVGEVGVDEQLHRAERGLVAEVADDEVLAHPLAHVPTPEHHERGVGETRARGAPGHERGREGVVGDHSQRLGPRPVHPQLEPGEDPLVPDEQALGRRGDDVALRGR